MSKFTAPPCKCSNLNCADLSCGRLDTNPPDDPDKATDALGRPVGLPKEAGLFPKVTSARQSDCAVCDAAIRSVPSLVEGETAWVRIDQVADRSHLHHPSPTPAVDPEIAAVYDVPPDEIHTIHPDALDLVTPSTESPRATLAQVIWHNLPGLSDLNAADDN